MHDRAPSGDAISVDSGEQGLRDGFEQILRFLFAPRSIVPRQKATKELWFSDRPRWKGWQVEMGRTRSGSQRPSATPYNLSVAVPATTKSLGVVIHPMLRCRPDHPTESARSVEMAEETTADSRVHVTDERFRVRVDSRRRRDPSDNRFDKVRSEPVLPITEHHISSKSPAFSSLPHGVKRDAPLFVKRATQQMTKRLGRDLALFLHPVHVDPESEVFAQGVSVGGEPGKTDVELVVDGEDLWVGGAIARRAGSLLGRRSRTSRGGSGGDRVGGGIQKPIAVGVRWDSVRVGIRYDEEETEQENEEIVVSKPARWRC